MADVTRPPRRSGTGSGSDAGDRGQLFLVGALSLAVLFVGFALLLNTAIYTENLATRNTDPGTDPSISYRSAAEEAAREMLIRESANNTGDPATEAQMGEMESRYERDVANWRDGVGIHSARRARAVSMSVDSISPGTRFEQTDINRNFTNSSGTATDWGLAADRDVREVQFTVENASLASTPSGAFALELESTDSAKVWNVSIYRPSATEVGVEVRNDTHTETCVAPVGSHAVVDVSGGAINDTACPELVRTLDLGGEGVDVEFENGDSAVGTYHLIVRGGANPSSDPDYEDNWDTGQPFVTAVIYEASVTVTYESTDVYYRTTIDISPPEELR